MVELFDMVVLEPVSFRFHPHQYTGSFVVIFKLIGSELYEALSGEFIVIIGDDALIVTFLVDVFMFPAESIAQAL